MLVERRMSLDCDALAVAVSPAIATSGLGLDPARPVSLPDLQVNLVGKKRSTSSIGRG